MVLALPLANIQVPTVTEGLSHHVSTESSPRGAVAFWKEGPARARVGAGASGAAFKYIQLQRQQHAAASSAAAPSSAAAACSIVSGSTLHLLRRQHRQRRHRRRTEEELVGSSAWWIQRVGIVGGIVGLVDTTSRIL